MGLDLSGETELLEQQETEVKHGQDKPELDAPSSVDDRVDEKVLEGVKEVQPEVVVESVKEVTEEPVSTHEEPEEQHQAEEIKEQVEAPQKTSAWSITQKFKAGLEKTRNSFTSKVNDLVARYRKVDEDFFEELEDVLLQADVGFETVMELMDKLRFEVQRQNIKDTNGIQDLYTCIMILITSMTKNMKKKQTY